MKSFVVWSGIAGAWQQASRSPGAYNRGLSASATSRTLAEYAARSAPDGGSGVVKKSLVELIGITHSASSPCITDTARIPSNLDQEYPPERHPQNTYTAPANKYPIPSSSAGSHGDYVVVCQFDQPNCSRQVLGATTISKTTTVSSWKTVVRGYGKPPLPTPRPLGPPKHTTKTTTSSSSTTTEVGKPDKWILVCPWDKPDCITPNSDAKFAARSTTNSSSGSDGRDGSVLDCPFDQPNCSSEAGPSSTAAVSPRKSVYTPSASDPSSPRTRYHAAGSVPASALAPTPTGGGAGRGSGGVGLVVAVAGLLAII